MATLEYTSARQRLDWLGWTTLVAAVPLLNFTVSTGLWLAWWGASAWNPYLRPRLLQGIVRELPCAAPAMLLFTLSAYCFRLALTRRTAMARRLLVVMLLSSLAFFWVDAHFQRIQVCIDFATESGRNGNVYITWWWYNDSWFR
jgi:hypothetical protein